VSGSGNSSLAIGPIFADPRPRYFGSALP